MLKIIKLSKCHKIPSFPYALHFFLMCVCDTLLHFSSFSLQNVTIRIIFCYFCSEMPLFSAPRGIILTKCHKMPHFPYALQFFLMCVCDTLPQNSIVFLTDCQNTLYSFE